MSAAGLFRPPPRSAQLESACAGHPAAPSRGAADNSSAKRDLRSATRAKSSAAAVLEGELLGCELPGRTRWRPPGRRCRGRRRPCRPRRGLPRRDPGRGARSPRARSAASCRRVIAGRSPALRDPAASGVTPSFGAAMCTQLAANAQIACCAAVACSAASPGSRSPRPVRPARRRAVRGRSPCGRPYEATGSARHRVTPDLMGRTRAGRVPRPPCGRSTSRAEYRSFSPRRSRSRASGPQGPPSAVRFARVARRTRSAGSPSWRRSTGRRPPRPGRRRSAR